MKRRNIASNPKVQKSFAVPTLKNEDGVKLLRHRLLSKACAFAPNSIKGGVMGKQCRRMKTTDIQNLPKLILKLRSVFEHNDDKKKNCLS